MTAPSPDKRFPPGLHVERERRPTISLKNTVVWPPKGYKQFGPFEFEEGKPSPLGVMLDFILGSPNKSEGLLLRTRLAGVHGRSADIGALYFKDEYGNIFRDADEKGAGAMEHDGLPQMWQTQEGMQRVKGLLDKGDALEDTQFSEEFAALGIRVSRTLGILELHELGVYDVGQPTLIGKESIEKLKEDELLLEKLVPAVQVRAFRTKTRVAEVYQFLHETQLEVSDRDERRRKELEDAIALIGDETGGAVHDAISYAEWFARTLGENVGRLHKNGYRHGCISSHNVTLACELTDFDTVKRNPAAERIVQEYDLAKSMLTDFLPQISSAFLNVPGVGQRFHTQELIALFHEAYEKENPGVPGIP